jgi:hypothetical protein
VTTEDPTAESPAATGLGADNRAGGLGADTPARPTHPRRATRPTDALGTAAPTEPLDVPTRTIVLVGTAVWALVLVVTLVVPSLHTGERSWWPWTCVTGIALGAFAWWYVGRGPRDTAGL